MSTCARAMAVILVFAVPGCRKPEPTAVREPTAAPEPAATPEPAPAPEPTAEPAQSSQPPSPSAKREEPISKVKGNAIYSPDPPGDALAETMSAALKKPRNSTVSFCVDTSGVTVDVATSVRSGDPKVDQICRKTVATWRFTPLLLDGKPVKTCSSVEFQIKFQ